MLQDNLRARNPVRFLTGKKMPEDIPRAESVFALVAQKPVIGQSVQQSGQRFGRPLQDLQTGLQATGRSIADPSYENFLTAALKVIGANDISMPGLRAVNISKQVSCPLPE